MCTAATKGQMHRSAEAQEPFHADISPRIRDASGVPDSAPVCAQVILRLGQLSIAWNRGRHAVLVVADRQTFRSSECARSSLEDGCL
jgi:hypothetical protein